MRVAFPSESPEISGTPDASGTPMNYLHPYDDDGALPICPSCGVTMHPLVDEGIDADECRECGFRLAWSDTGEAGAEDLDDRWDD